MSLLSPQKQLVLCSPNSSEMSLLSFPWRSVANMSLLVVLIEAKASKAKMTQQSILIYGIVGTKTTSTLSTLFLNCPEEV